MWMLLVMVSANNVLRADYSHSAHIIMGDAGHQQELFDDIGCALQVHSEIANDQQ